MAAQILMEWAVVQGAGISTECQADDTLLLVWLRLDDKHTLHTHELEFQVAYLCRRAFSRLLGLPQVSELELVNRGASVFSSCNRFPILGRGGAQGAPWWQSDGLSLGPFHCVAFAGYV